MLFSEQAVEEKNHKEILKIHAKIMFFRQQFVQKTFLFARNSKNFGFRLGGGGSYEDCCFRKVDFSDGQRLDDVEDGVGIEVDNSIADVSSIDVASTVVDNLSKDIDNACWAQNDTMRSWESCCNPEKFDKFTGNTSCWTQGYLFSTCCHRKLPDSFHGVEFSVSRASCSANSAGITDFLVTGFHQERHSDKVIGGFDNHDEVHTYHRMYGTFLESLRGYPIKMLEIGLGCNMDYGAGASVCKILQNRCNFNFCLLKTIKIASISLRFCKFHQNFHRFLVPQFLEFFEF